MNIQRHLEQGYGHWLANGRHHPALTNIATRDDGGDNKKCVEEGNECGEEGNGGARVDVGELVSEVQETYYQVISGLNRVWIVLRWLSWKVDKIEDVVTRRGGAGGVSTLFKPLDILLALLFQT